jgi:hypothetical protein
MRHLLLAAVLVAQCNPVHAAEETAAEVVIDSTTERALLDACAYLRSAEQFSARFDVSYDDVLLDGTKVQYSRREDVTMARPNRLRADVVGDRGVRRIYYDGATVTVYRPAGAVYARAEAPDDLDGTLELAARKGITIPLDDLLFTQPCAALAESLRTGTYAGLHYLDDDWHHHLLLSTDAVDVQMWVATGDEPLIRKVVITYRGAPGAPQYVAAISGWDFDPPIDESTFHFAPPPGVREVAFRVPDSAQGGVTQ